MKNLILLSFAIFLSTAFFAQENNPVIWKAHYQKISATEGEIVIEAQIQKNWHTYSQRPTEDGPIPTSFTFTPSPAYELVGAAIESEAHEEFVPAFDAKIFVFTNKAEFRQKIKLSGKPGFIIKLSVEYMSCNDMMCLPPKTIELSVMTQ